MNHRVTSSRHAVMQPTPRPAQAGEAAREPARCGAQAGEAAWEPARHGPRAREAAGAGGGHRFPGCGVAGWGVVLRVAAVAFVLASSTVARADRRNFAFSYDAVTLGKGQIEVEQYLTSRSFRDPLVGDHDTGWQYQLELEYGVTDHFDVAAYQVFGTGKPDGEMDWSGYKLRGRYRPSDQGEWFIDPVVYLELIQSADGGITLEQKLILGRVFGRFITTLNLTFEQEHLNQDEQEYVIAPSFAAGFQPWPWLTLGGEVLSKTAFEDGETEHMAFAGPAISLAHGRLWLTVTMLTRFAGGEVDALREDYRIRGILGLYL